MSFCCFQHLLQYNGITFCSLNILKAESHVNCTHVVLACYPISCDKLPCMCCNISPSMHKMIQINIYYTYNVNKCITYILIKHSYRHTRKIMKYMKQPKYNQTASNSVFL